MLQIEAEAVVLHPQAIQLLDHREQHDRHRVLVVLLDAVAHAQVQDLLAQILLLMTQLTHLLLELLARGQAVTQLGQRGHLGIIGLLLFVLVIAYLLKHGFVLSAELVLLVLELVLLVPFFFD